MFRNALLFIFLALAATASADTSKILSPSENLYYQGNEHYYHKDFDKAIELYKEYLERKPNGELAISAALNLGMSYYYKGELKNAYFALKDIKLDDENIKKAVNGVIETCKAEAAEEIAEAEKEKSEAAAAQETPPDESLVAASDQLLPKDIQIVVFDAFLNTFGYVELKGRTDRPSSVTVDGSKADMSEQKAFSASVSWKKGSAIVIAAQDTKGASGRLEYFPDRESPREPINLRAVSVSPNTAVIEWDHDPSDEDIRGYKFYYQLQGGSVHEASQLIDENNYEVIGLERLVSGPNRTIEFYVKAVDKMLNESEPSDILEVELPE